MLIAHSMPAVTGLSITGGEWLTADGGAALHDGKPARVARLQAGSAPSITASFGSAFKPRIIGLLGLRGVAVGTIITAKGAGGAALGGNAGSQPVVRFADGTLGAWILTSDTVSTASVVVTIAGAGQIDIGELVAMPALEADINRDWVDGYVDPSEVSMGRGSQPAISYRTPYRTLTATLSPEGVARVRGIDATNWQHLRAALAGGRRAVAIPRWRTPQGQIDVQELQATAIYCTGQIPSIGHLAGNYYGAEMTFQEVPAAA